MILGKRIKVMLEVTGAGVVSATDGACAGLPREMDIEIALSDEAPDFCPVTPNELRLLREAVLERVLAFYSLHKKGADSGSLLKRRCCGRRGTECSGRASCSGC